MTTKRRPPSRKAEGEMIRTTILCFAAMLIVGGFVAPAMVSARDSLTAIVGGVLFAASVALNVWQVARAFKFFNQ